MSAPHLHLISFDTCPYVERSRIVLEEKGVDYDITFVDLKNKPEWFLKISPRGKVPVLVVDDQPIFESMVINEYLEDAFPEHSMFPSDPVLRGQARAWIVFANDVVMPAWSRTLFARSPEDLEKATADLREALVKVDGELQRHGKAYFFGDDFGLVDAVYAPIFSRFEAAQELGRAAAWDGLEALLAYGEQLLARPAAQRARAENLTEKTVAYVNRISRA